MEKSYGFIIEDGKVFVYGPMDKLPELVGSPEAYCPNGEIVEATPVREQGFLFQLFAQVSKSNNPLNALADRCTNSGCWFLTY